MKILAFCMFIMVIDILSLHSQIDDLQRKLNNLVYISYDDFMQLCKNKKGEKEDE